MLDTLLPANVKAKLHYIAVVACKIFETKPKTKEINKFLTIELSKDDRAYMLKLMQGLHGAGMRPVVAGWDVPITAAPYQPTNMYGAEEAVWDDRTGSPAKVTDLTAIRGKKIVTHGDQKCMLVTDEYRRQHKHLYQVTSEGKLRMGLGGWSRFVGATS